MTTDSNERQGEALLPCPLAHRVLNGVTIADREDRVYIYCKDCGLQIGGRDRETVITCWNARSRASLAAVANHALVQLLESALLHPESAEGNIRQVIEMLSAVEGDWLPIAMAPKQRKIIVGYFNPLGKWRTVLARYYLENELEWHDQSPNYGEGFAPEGWYELCETHEDILPTDHEPTHWRPLPAAPNAAASSPLPAEKLTPLQQAMVEHDDDMARMDRNTLSAESPCERCTNDVNYLPAYYDEEVKAWLHRGRTNEGYLCRLKHPNGFDAPAEPPHDAKFVPPAEDALHIAICQAVQEHHGPSANAILRTALNDYKPTQLTRTELIRVQQRGGSGEVTTMMVSPAEPEGEQERLTGVTVGSSRHPHFTHADHERMKATLDALPDNPTEEEAEAVLQVCGTSGKEVVNEFIERLLRERSEMQAELERLRTVTPPETPVVAREIAREWMNTHHASFETNQKREDALAAIITRYLGATGPTVAGLPICPKCQQGYICEHCGEPIGDYYADILTAPVRAAGDDEGEWCDDCRAYTHTPNCPSYTGRNQ